MTKGAEGFTGSVRVPYGEKVVYKFIVDGSWSTNNSEPTEVDGSGNVNNVQTTPNAPSPSAEPTTTAVEEKKPNGSTLKGKREPRARVSLSQFIADFASTVAATDGTTSAAQYVASGVGAAIQGVIGIDPVNTQHVRTFPPSLFPVLGPSHTTHRFLSKLQRQKYRHHKLPKSLYRWRAMLPQWNSSQSTRQ